MSEVSHFQTYSQPENHVTNNTLLVLRHFYQAAPLKLPQILNSLLDEDFKLKIGVFFEQQHRRENSVLDALIHQPSLLIGVETKRHTELWPDQIKRHIDGMTSSLQEGTYAVLIALVKEPISATDLQNLQTYANEKRITFKAVTFSQPIESLRAACAEYEQSLSSILPDYERFISKEHLLDDRSEWIAVVPCGTSYQENKGSTCTMKALSPQSGIVGSLEFTKTELFL